jgi:hypothetical protein
MQQYDPEAIPTALWSAVSARLRSVTPLGDPARLNLVKSLATSTDLPPGLPSADLDETATEWVQDILHAATEDAAVEADVIATLIEHPSMFCLYLPVGIPLISG